GDIPSAQLAGMEDLEELDLEETGSLEELQDIEPTDFFARIHPSSKSEIDNRKSLDLEENEDWSEWDEEKEIEANIPNLSSLESLDLEDNDDWEESEPEDINPFAPLSDESLAEDSLIEEDGNNLADDELEAFSNTLDLDTDKDDTLDLGNVSDSNTDDLFGNNNGESEADQSLLVKDKTDESQKQETNNLLEDFADLELDSEEDDLFEDLSLESNSELKDNDFDDLFSGLTSVPKSKRQQPPG
ncbi:MAG: hypothetical protein F6K10_26600, partial [Moorea sp. SIO2B7]|nr:hypothetical protein [Moorena sp. SIO2B7]